MGRQQVYSKDDVSRMLKNVGWLKSKDINQHPNLPSIPTILNLFKTTKISDVWRELGISPQPKFTKEEVARMLKETGWVKNQYIEDHPDLPSMPTIFKLFKTTKMSDVWKELKIGPVSLLTKHQHRYTKEKVGKALKKTGYLKEKVINQHPDLPVVTTILRLFEKVKMSDVWKELGVPFKSRPSYTKKEVAKALKKVGWLKDEDINQHSRLPSCSTIQRLFKTKNMRKVWEKFNIPALNYTKESITRKLKEAGWLSHSEINRHPELPPWKVIAKLFEVKKMSDVWEKLNIQELHYTKESITRALKKTGWLSHKQIDRHPELPTTHIILRLFNKTKMNDVWQELDIPFTSQPTCFA